MIKRFEKQLLRLGTWKHPQAPNGILSITKDYIKQIVENYKRTPFAPVVRGHISNSLAEQNPDLIINKNIAKLNIKEDGLYAEMDIDDKELDKYNDVSVAVADNYEDKETGKIIGPVLQHVAMVVNPYIKGMKSFTALSENDGLYIINLSDINEMANKELEKEVALEETTVESNVAPVETETPAEDVKPEVDAEEVKTDEAPVAEEAKEEAVEAEVAETKEETTEVEKEEVDASDDLSKKVIELEEKLRQQEILLAEKDASELYDSLLRAGKVVPAQKDALMALASKVNSTVMLSDGSEKTVKVLLQELFANAPKLINLEEQGIDAEEIVQLSDDKVKNELRKLPVHAKKSEEEFEAWWGKVKDVAVKAAQ